MQTFTDANGRTWTVRVTVDVCRKVAASTGYKLMELSNGHETYDRLVHDIPAFVQAIHIAAETDGKKPTLAEFEDAIFGDTIDAATVAFLRALSDFFPKPKRESLLGVMALYQAALEKNLTTIRKAELTEKV